MSTQHNTPADPPERFADPGLEPHHPRSSDLDPRAAKRAERQIVLILLIGILGFLVAIVGYFLFPAGETVMGVRLGTTAIGVGMGVGLLGIGIALVQWAKTLMNSAYIVEERKELRSSNETRAAALATVDTVAADTNLARRPVLKGALGAAIAVAPLPFVVTLVGGLTPDWDITRFSYTAWRNKPKGAAGRRLATDPEDRPIRAADVTSGSVFHVIPHELGELPGEDHFLNEKSKAMVLLVRIPPEELKVSAGREDWNYHGIIAFSKVCTHVGCPVALYEQNTRHLLCPCHQSTFDLTDEARVIFGPAKRPLPQLPIAVDEEGYLIATSDFHEPVGPSYWERAK